MSTLLIGFESKVGTFTNSNTGEVINYSNRVLNFITDDGQTDKIYGFAPFTYPKVKREVIAQSLGVADNDNAVDNALRALKLKPVEVQIAPRNGELTCVGIKAVK